MTSDPKNHQTIVYRPAAPADLAPAEAIVARAFGPGRFAKTAYRLREGVQPVDSLAFVAERGGVLVGTIQYWPVRIADAPALLLGPLAVEANERGVGAGLELMRISLGAAKAQGHDWVILVGDEAYYAKVGFQKLTGVVLPGPVNPARVLGLSLMGKDLTTLVGLLTAVEKRNL